MAKLPRPNLEDEVFISEAEGVDGVRFKEGGTVEWVYRLGGVGDLIWGVAALVLCARAAMESKVYNHRWGISALILVCGIGLYYLVRPMIRYRVTAGPHRLSIRREVLGWTKTSEYDASAEDLEIVRKGEVGPRTQTYSLKITGPKGRKLPGQFSASTIKAIHKILADTLGTR